MERQEKVLYVRLSGVLHRRLKVAAAKCGRTISELAREAVEQYVAATEKSDG